ncbi:MAG: crotonase/enoyl-CoA hydratase family protein [Myxococcota bacterium]
MTEARITTEKRGEHVWAIGLDRADKLNAFDTQMLGELSEAYTAYEEDDDLWCAVVYPVGENFTSGLELDDVAPNLDGAALFPEDKVDPLGLRGRTRSKPVILAARGWCLTIGIELMLASDIRLAGADTQFGQIEVSRGIFPFGGATLRWPRLSGWGDAMRYMLTGEKFGAVEAKRMRLVQEVHPPEEVVERAFQLAEIVAKQAPLGVQAVLESSRLVEEEGFDAALDAMPGQLAEVMSSEDAAEGVRSFIERREAEFKGE